MSVNFSSSRLTLVVIAVLKLSFAAHQAKFKPTTSRIDNTTGQKPQHTTGQKPHYQVVGGANGVSRTDTIQSELIQALRPHSSIVKTLEPSAVTSQAPPLVPKTKQLYDVIVKTARETPPSADVASLLTLLPAVGLNDTSVTSTSDKRTATGASPPSLRDVHVDVCASVCGACRAVLSLRWATLCDVECESDQQPPGQVLNACITLWSLQESAPQPPPPAAHVM